MQMKGNLWSTRVGMAFALSRKVPGGRIIHQRPSNPLIQSTNFASHSHTPAPTTKPCPFWSLNYNWCCLWLSLAVVGWATWQFGSGWSMYPIFSALQWVSPVYVHFVMVLVILYADELCLSRQHSSYSSNATAISPEWTQQLQVIMPTSTTFWKGRRRPILFNLDLVFLISLSLFSHRRALKATAILVPLFGLQLLMIIYRPSPQSAFSAQYEILAAIITNSQVWCYVIFYV